MRAGLVLINKDATASLLMSCLIIMTSRLLVIILPPVCRDATLRGVGGEAVIYNAYIKPFNVLV